MKAVLLLGPTASGKTAVTLELATRFPIEVVSVDSAQVYRGLDVGTAKPGAAARERIPHHLVDIEEPIGAYSAGRFRADALRLVAEIQGRGRVPVLAGGTMLYYRALTRGIADMPVANPEVRARLEARGKARGWPALHRELAEVDPASAARIDPRDSQRIQRALEVHQVSGRPLADWHAHTDVTPLPFEALAIALEPADRSVLHQRIATRFHEMLEAGLVDELRRLRAHYRLEATLPAMRTVGYRQAWDTLEGSEPEATLADRGIAATRQLAKRQLTWMRSMDALERYDCLRPDLAAAVSGRVGEFLSLPRGT